MTEPDVAQIAFKLTKAQRAAILNLPETDNWRCGPRIQVWGYLRRKNLARAAGVLTPLGLAVRQHLEEQK